MNVSLAPYRLIPEPSTGIHDDAKEQHPSLKLIKVTQASDIHCDCIDWIGATAIRVAEAASNSIETAIFRPRPEQSVFITNIHTACVEAHLQARIELEFNGRRSRSWESHFSPHTRDAFPLTLSNRALKPSRRIAS